jgi:hypothetical protein
MFASSAAKRLFSYQSPLDLIHPRLRASTIRNGMIRNYTSHRGYAESALTDQFSDRAYTHQIRQSSRPWAVCRLTTGRGYRRRCRGG